MIALDIGNGSIKWARFSDGALVESGRLPLDAEPGSLDAAVAVSVNPPVAEGWAQALPSLRIVGRDVPRPIPVHADGCGDDRVCALAGALLEFEGALVLDAGTCLVATAGTRTGGLLGGAILPGPDLMARALSTGTAALPLVLPGAGGPAVARSTDAAIRAGIDAAVVGAVRELIARIRAELGGPLTVLATGTGGESLASRVPEIEHFRPHLPLWGAYRSLGSA